MDENVQFLEFLPPESYKLTPKSPPFFQSQHNSYWSIENLILPDYDFFVCTRGEAVFSQKGKSFELTEGKAFLALPHFPLSAVHTGSVNFDAMAQHLELKVFGDIDLFSLIEFDQIITFSNWPRIKSSLEEYKELYAANNQRLKQYNFFQVLITEFLYLSCRGRKPENQDEYHFIFQMLNYIDNHLTDENVLAMALNLSPYTHDYSSRLFRKKMGIPPKQYVLKTRLELSQNLLRKSCSVKETAYNSGFHDELYFSKIFKKNMNITPREFKIQNGLSG